MELLSTLLKIGVTGLAMFVGFMIVFSSNEDGLRPAPKVDGTKHHDAHSHETGAQSYYQTSGTDELYYRTSGHSGRSATYYEGDRSALHRTGLYYSVPSSSVNPTYYRSTRSYVDVTSIYYQQKEQYFRQSEQPSRPYYTRKTEAEPTLKLKDERDDGADSPAYKPVQTVESGVQTVEPKRSYYELTKPISESGTPRSATSPVPTSPMAFNTLGGSYYSRTQNSPVVVYYQPPAGSGYGRSSTSNRGGSGRQYQVGGTYYKSLL